MNTSLGGAWALDVDLFELSCELDQIATEPPSFHFNPFLLADPLMLVGEDQFEFCVGLLKLIAAMRGQKCFGMGGDAGMDMLMV
jgi:hypothetical protein